VKGKRVSFSFSGNPTGGNADLGDEVFQYDVKKGTLSQLTTMGGWCSNSPTTACTQSADCQTQQSNGTCRKASVGNLQVSTKGNVSFTTTGNPDGSNAAHSNALFFYKSGKKSELRSIGLGGAYCRQGTENAGVACTTDDDCGAVCGDGTVSGNEQCEPFGYGASGCAAPQACAQPSEANPCQCRATVCGDDRIEGSEVCEPNFGCGFGFTCSSNCSQCQPASPSGAFVQ
jgi:hypothetical protein